MSRLVVMAHFDYEGDVAPHVRRQVEAWSQTDARLIVVTTATLGEPARAWLSERCTLIERANYGYDFLSYRTGLAAAGPLDAYDEVVVCNDSYVGPLRPYAQIFAEMGQQRVDFWGITRSLRIAPHVQSFFVVFRPWVVASRTFTRFWSEMLPSSDRQQVIRRYEVGMSGRLLEAGFRAGSYFEETAADRAVARRRVIWWASRRQPGLRSTGLRGSHLRRWAAEAWNPGAALADRALPDGRLPLVKVDTLRHDPYGLGAESLLSRCEQQFPEAFAGVRSYLERTAPLYPSRPREQLLPAPRVLRPARPLVAY